uniref:(northern house mosquito) hypothetical protein n=1 Tax=Culex pipiens TaxID=7175 RepID=A0A8D8EW91_CULPI
MPTGTDTGMTIAIDGIGAAIEIATIGIGRIDAPTGIAVETVTSVITVLGVAAAEETEARVVSGGDGAGRARVNIETDLASGRTDGENIQRTGIARDGIFRWRSSRSCRICASCRT